MMSFKNSKKILFQSFLQDLLPCEAKQTEIMKTNTDKAVFVTVRCEIMPLYVFTNDAPRLFDN